MRDCKNSPPSACLNNNMTHTGCLPSPHTERCKLPVFYHTMIHTARFKYDIEQTYCTAPMHNVVQIYRLFKKDYCACLYHNRVHTFLKNTKYWLHHLGCLQFPRNYTQHILINYPPAQHARHLLQQNIRPICVHNTNPKLCATCSA